jgi:hypothetical protein
MQTWTGPEGSVRLRLPDIKTVGTWRRQGFHSYALAAFTPKEIFLVLISVRGWGPQDHSAAEKIMWMKNLSDNIMNQTRDILACNAFPQPAAPPRALT